MQKSPGKLPQILQLKDYWLAAPSVQRTMLIVCLALAPGVLVNIVVYGAGVIQNLLLSIIFGLILELILHSIRGHSIKDFPFDATGLVMAIIFALTLPPSVPWWILLTGIFFAITIGKYAFGGTGNNLFNPAMVGVAAILISFPLEMNQWMMTIDGQSSATPLDTIRTSLRLSHMMSEIETGIFGLFAAAGHEWINLAYLCGGIVLIQQKIIRWHIPVGVLCGLFLIAMFFQLLDPDLYPGALFHLFGGATMICAFFVATDPVTSPVTAKGRFIYGFLIGIMIYTIRTWGSYTDGVTFAVLIMNATVPVLDHFTRSKAPA